MNFWVIFGGIFGKFMDWGVLRDTPQSEIKSKLNRTNLKSNPNAKKYSSMIHPQTFFELIKFVYFNSLVLVLEIWWVKSLKLCEGGYHPKFYWLNAYKKLIDTKPTFWNPEFLKTLYYSYLLPCLISSLMNMSSVFMKSTYGRGMIKFSYTVRFITGVTFLLVAMFFFFFGSKTKNLFNLCFASMCLGFGNSCIQLTVTGYTKFFSPNTFAAIKLGYGTASFTLTAFYLSLQYFNMSFIDVTSFFDLYLIKLFSKILFSENTFPYVWDVLYWYWIYDQPIINFSWKFYFSHKNPFLLKIYS